VSAEALTLAASLRTVDGRLEGVDALQLLPDRATTYNLEGAKTHTYFAGGVLVHDRKEIP
jgi:hypothetical protein